MPLSKLYALEPAKTERGVSECATSYLIYLMREHRLRVRPMFEYLAEHAALKLSASLALGTIRDESSFDGVGVRANALISTLSAFTGVVDLQRMTLNPLSSACAGNGLGLLHARRRWCPDDFKQWHASGTRAFIPLHWRIAAVKYCVEHDRPLENCCPHCHATQRVLPRQLRVDLCDTCGKPLFDCCAEDQNPILSRENDLDCGFSEQVTLILGDSQYGIERIQEAPVANFFTQLLRLHGIGPKELGRRIGVHQDTIKQWCRDRRKPRLDLLLAVLSEVSVPLRLMLWSPNLAASQALVPEVARRQIATERKGAPRRAHDRRQVRSAVRKFLKLRKGYVQCHRAAKALNIPAGSLYYLAADLFRAQRRKRA